MNFRVSTSRTSAEIRKVKTLPIFILFVIGFFGSAPLFTQESDAFASLELAIKADNAQDAGSALEKLSADKTAEAEKLLLEKAKNLVLADKLDLATAFAEIVLLFNLDNTLAQDLYTSIEQLKLERKKLEEKKQKIKEDEERKQREAAEAQERERLAKEAALAKAEADRLADEEKARLEKIKKDTEEARLREIERVENERLAREAEVQRQKDAYLQSVRVITQKNFSGSVFVSPAVYNVYRSDFADLYTETTNVNQTYGLAAKANANFRHPFISLRAYTDIQWQVLALTPEADTRLALGAGLEISSPQLPLPLGLRTGYKRFTYGLADSILFETFASPMLGLTIPEIRPIAPLRLALWADYGLTALLNDTVDYFIVPGISIRYSLSPLKGLGKLGLELTSEAEILGAAAQNEWNISTILSIGVLFNEN